MEVSELKNKIDALFPCIWKDDFKVDISDIFDKYIDIVNSCIDLDDTILSNIKTFCNQLIEIVDLYYDGRRGVAFDLFTSIMNGCEECNGLFESIGKIDVTKDDFFYRARVKDEGNSFGILDMFHIPLNKRGLVKTQRYSSPGFPCLYLGNSLYSCWEELRRTSFESLVFSAYRARRSFRLFDMRIPYMEDYQNEKLNQTLKRIPLVIACSIAVKHQDDAFKPEYIIPQFLTELIIINNKSILHNKMLADSPSVIWGIIYSSTHIHEDFTYGRKYMENIILPVVETSAKENYCHYLASLFDISQPSCYEILKENILHLESCGEEDEYEYESSAMGIMENKLKSSDFKELPHIYVPSVVIELDWRGEQPVKVPIYSNVDWEIE